MLTKIFFLVLVTLPTVISRSFIQIKERKWIALGLCEHKVFVYMCVSMFSIRIERNYAKIKDIQWQTLYITLMRCIFAGYSVSFHAE